jgi:hypothetical protein
LQTVRLPAQPTCKKYWDRDEESTHGANAGDGRFLQVLIRPENNKKLALNII